MENENHLDSRGFLRARPVRVAYVIDTNNAHLALDAVFAECHGRWGGRYTLLVPAEQGKLAPAYLPWLTAYDPDIIYSYVDLDDEQVRDLHERVGPSYLIRHESRGIKGEEIDKHYFRPNLPIQCLSSLSTAPQYARAFPVSAPQPILVVDYLPGQSRDRFVDDNIGSYYNSFERWPIPEQLADVVQPLTLASEDRLKDLHGGRQKVRHSVNDTPSLLEFMAKQHNSVGVAQLAADSAPRLNIRVHFDQSFSIIIGNSFEDRLLFWNQRSFMPAYLGRSFATLIVEPHRLTDDTFFKALIEFIKSRNGVIQSQGTPWVTLRSASLAKEQLAPIQQRFNAADTWNSYHLESGKYALDVGS